MLGERGVCFAFSHISHLSGLFGSAHGRKCVMLSDNRVKKLRDPHIHLRHWQKQLVGSAFNGKDIIFLTWYSLRLKKYISKLQKQYLLK